MRRNRGWRLKTGRMPKIASFTKADQKWIKNKRLSLNPKGEDKSVWRRKRPMGKKPEGRERGREGRSSYGRRQKGSGGNGVFEKSSCEMVGECEGRATNNALWRDGAWAPMGGKQGRGQKKKRFK